MRRRPLYTAATTETLLRYAKALGCRNPLYTDLAHGILKTPWGSVVGHPTSIFGFDNTVVAPKLPGIHAIYAGVTIEWFRQIRAGERISTSAALTERAGKDRCVLRPDGVAGESEDHLRRCDGRAGRARASARAPHAARPSARDRPSTRASSGMRIPAVEFEKILSAYRDEHVQGSKPSVFRGRRRR